MIARRVKTPPHHADPPVNLPPRVSLTSRTRPAKHPDRVYFGGHAFRANMTAPGEAATGNGRDLLPTRPDCDMGVPLAAAAVDVLVEVDQPGQAPRILGLQFATYPATQATGPASLLPTELPTLPRKP